MAQYDCNIPSELLTEIFDGCVFPGASGTYYSIRSFPARRLRGRNMMVFKISHYTKEHCPALYPPDSWYDSSCRTGMEVASNLKGRRCIRRCNLVLVGWGRTNPESVPQPDEAAKPNSITSFSDLVRWNGITTPGNTYLSGLFSNQCKIHCSTYWCHNRMHWQTR